MRQLFHEIVRPTRGKGLYEVTAEIADWLGHSGIRQGLLTLLIRHTSASLLVQENADPSVRSDMEKFFARLVPEGDALFEHTQEGADDMPAHVRAALTQTSLSLPVRGGQMALGTWQGVYVFEHRRMPQQRRIMLHLLGE